MKTQIVTDTYKSGETTYRAQYKGRFDLTWQSIRFGYYSGGDEIVRTGNKSEAMQAIDTFLDKTPNLVITVEDYPPDQ